MNLKQEIGAPALKSPYTKTSLKKRRSPTTGPSVKPTEEIRSPYLVQRLLETNNENLFNHVKFHLVKQAIDELNIENPRILDIGCGLQVSRQYLEKLNLKFDYCGVDYESKFKPDAVVDLSVPTALEGKLPWKPDVVMMLDVLEHVNEDPAEIKKILANVRRAIGDKATIIVTLPQLYRMDRFKFKHLHYPEHKIRLTQHEWREVLESEFEISRVQGLGYLSVIPYLPMISKRYTPENKLGSLFNYLRGTFFEWSGFKPADLFLSNTLGRLSALKTVSNDVLFIATPKK